MARINKPRRVVLYGEQAEACKELFARANKDASKGKPGAVLAQVVLRHDKTAFLEVIYVNGEQAEAIRKITGGAGFYDNNGDEIKNL